MLINRIKPTLMLLISGIVLCVTGAAWGQLIDRTLAPNTANEGIAKSFQQEVGAGRGDSLTPGSSKFIITRDPFRAVRRGRQIFQRKFTRSQGQGPLQGDGAGNINDTLAIGAGLGDACATCHGRPRGSAGFGGDVVTRPDSRDAPHLFGLGLKEMLADEITAELRRTRDAAKAQALSQNRRITLKLLGKGIPYGFITAYPNGTLDTTAVEGVNGDLRVRPFFHHGGTISMREFLVGAFQAEMGLQPIDPDLAAAQAGARIVTPSGMVLNGATDDIEVAFAQDATIDEDNDGVFNEIPVSIVDFMEFYLLNYFKAGTGEQSTLARNGRRTMEFIGCTKCHVPDLTIEKDRRVADLETTFDPIRGISFNRLFATAAPKFTTINDGSGLPPLKKPALGRFLVKNIFTDFKRHDLGPNFHERNYDGTLRTRFLTTPLWGVGSSSPYGHDGRSISLREVILRHGGEAQDARDKFDRCVGSDQESILAFLNSLILFPPDDTPSTLNPGNAATPGFPQFGHGAIALSVLFNNPADPE
jgi:hypothetical protein